jgi:hypothetical protein
MPETQETIATWVKDTFPHLGEKEAKSRVLRIAEESVELAFMEGVEEEEYLNHCRAQFRICELQLVTRGAEDEVADVAICLYGYAAEKGLDVLNLVEEKMKRNRAKPQAFFNAKRKAKDVMGLAIK